MRLGFNALLFLLVLSPMSALAENPGYSSILQDGTTLDYTCMPAIAGAASIPNPKMRFVFIRFPQVGTWNEGNFESYPSWANPAGNPSWLEHELQQYFVAMSVGAQNPDIQIVTDPDHPGQPWTADFEANYYVNLAHQQPPQDPADVFNHEILLKIHNAYLTHGYPNGYWVGVQYIFVVAYDQPYSDSYTVGGFTNWDGTLPGAWGAPGLPTHGYASHLFVRMDRPPHRDAFDTPTNVSVAGGTVHEYGHVLGMFHSPYSGNYQYPEGSGQDPHSGPCVLDAVPPRYHMASRFPICEVPNPPSCPDRCGHRNPPYNPPDPSWNCICIRCGHVGEPECTDPIYINVGRYDPLRGIGGPEPGERIVPYHPLQLAIAQTGWIQVQTIDADVRDFHIPQLRNPDPNKRRVFMVKPSQASQYFNQYFLLSNHQGNPSDPILQFDATYQGHGLLIWHIIDDLIWDLESAAGEIPDDSLGQRFAPALPMNPPHRGDALARSWTFMGSAADFFNSDYGIADFSAATNPNSNYYVEKTPGALGPPLDYWSPQTAISHIGVENIRQDPSGDIVVDIYVDPKQNVTYPNGGENVSSSEGFTLSWDRRDLAGITSVNIFTSHDGGQSWGPYSTGHPNSGQATIAGPLAPLGSAWRTKVVSFDATASAEDASDGNFTVWGIDEATIQQTVTQDCNGAIKFDISWNTTVTTDGWDSLLVYAPGAACGSGSAQVARAASPGISHHVIWEGTCQSGLWRYVLKSTKGTGVTASSCQFASITECWTQTTEVPSVIETSMAAWADVNPDPGFMTLHFTFGTTQCATEFEVQYRLYGTTNWWTLTCSSPGSSCIFNGNKTYERTQGYTPCEETSFQWRARAKNWNGWQQTYSAVKSFKAYCLQEP